MIRKNNLLIPARNQLACFRIAEPEQDIERRLLHQSGIDLPANSLERKGFLNIIVMSSLGDEHTLVLQHIGRYTFEEPRFPAHTLPLEVARKIGVGVGIGILEIGFYRMCISALCQLERQLPPLRQIVFDGYLGYRPGVFCGNSLGYSSVMTHWKISFLIGS